jgi:hypothetical protein
MDKIRALKYYQERACLEPLEIIRNLKMARLIIIVVGLANLVHCLIELLMKNKDDE